MLGKTVAVFVLAAACLVIRVPSSLAGSKIDTAVVGWFDTNSNAADSDANPAEKVLTPTVVKKIKYLRSVVAPPVSRKMICSPDSVEAPLPYGGYLYSITDGTISKYNPANGKLIWQHTLNYTNSYESLSVSGKLLIVAGIGCESASEPGGVVYALNTSTGARVWMSPDQDGTINDMVKAAGYVIVAGSDAAGYEAAVFNVSNGTSVWHSYGDCGNGDSTPALVVDLLVMTYGCDSQGNQDIEARNLATGVVVWSLSGNWTLQRGDLPSSAGQHLYATDPSGTVEALNAQTGQVQYSLDGAANVLAVDSSRAYATCGNQDLQVCAYNSSTGAQEWQSPYLDTNTPPTLAAEADGVLYAGEGTALNAATGTVITTVWGSSGYVSSLATALAVGDGRIAVVTDADPRVMDIYGLPGY